MADRIQTGDTVIVAGREKKVIAIVGLRALVVPKNVTSPVVEAPLLKDCVSK